MKGRMQSEAPGGISSIATGETSPVAAVLTHDLSPILRPLIESLIGQARALSAEFVVVASSLSEETRSWLLGRISASALVELPSGCGPGAARNAVLSRRPRARAYFFFDDDLILEGRELTALSRILESEDAVGLASGLPVGEDGTPLIPRFERRPGARAFPGIWNRWWGECRPAERPEWIEADIASSASIALRGAAIRRVGGFDPIFWPGCHEDTDVCARLRSAGFRIVVDRSTPVPQKISTTMRHVLGEKHLVHCRATGVIYAAMDYPLVFAAGRILQAVLLAFTSRDPVHRRGDADGLIRCARSWRYVLRARRIRRDLGQTGHPTVR